MRARRALAIGCIGLERSQIDDESAHLLFLLAVRGRLLDVQTQARTQILDFLPAVLVGKGNLG